MNKRVSIDGPIRQAWLASKKRYGASKIRMTLIQQGILGQPPTRSTPNASDAHSVHLPEALSQVWVSDITYLRHLSGWTYLTIVMDLADRKIIG